MKSSWCTTFVLLETLIEVSVNALQRLHIFDVLCIHIYMTHDNVIKKKHFPRYWPFVRGSHWSPVNSPHKGQWHRVKLCDRFVYTFWGYRLTNMMSLDFKAGYLIIFLYFSRHCLLYWYCKWSSRSPQALELILPLMSLNTSQQMNFPIKPIRR